jgi:hypothetical protein
MKYMLAILLASTLCIPAFSKEQKADFQAAKIINVERIPGRATVPPSPPGYSNPGSPTEAQEGPSIDRFNVSVQVGDTIYTCRLKSYDPDNTDFTPGADVQARVTKNVVYLMRSTGDVEEAPILGKKKAEAQAQAQ